MPFFLPVAVTVFDSHRCSTTVSPSVPCCLKRHPRMEVVSMIACRTSMDRPAKSRRQSSHAMRFASPMSSPHIVLGRRRRNSRHLVPIRSFVMAKGYPRCLSRILRSAEQTVKMGSFLGGFLRGHLQVGLFDLLTSQR